MHDGDGDGHLLGLLHDHHHHHRLADNTQAGTTRQTFKRESTFVALERTKCELWFSADKICRLFMQLKEKGCFRSSIQSLLIFGMIKR